MVSFLSAFCGACSAGVVAAVLRGFMALLSFAYILASHCLSQSLCLEGLVKGLLPRLCLVFNLTVEWGSVQWGGGYRLSMPSRKIKRLKAEKVTCTVQSSSWDEPTHGSDVWFKSDYEVRLRKRKSTAVMFDANVSRQQWLWVWRDEIAAAIRCFCCSFWLDGSVSPTGTTAWSYGPALDVTFQTEHEHKIWTFDIKVLSQDLLQ